MSGGSQTTLDTRRRSGIKSHPCTSLLRSEQYWLKISPQCVTLMQKSPRYDSNVASK